MYIYRQCESAVRASHHCVKCIMVCSFGSAECEATPMGCGGLPYSSVLKEMAGVAAPSPIPDWAATQT